MARDWPPRFIAASSGPSPEPSRPGLPGGLPPRPTDLSTIRRHRRVRIAAKASAAVVAAAVSIGVSTVALGAVVRRSR